MDTGTQTSPSGAPDTFSGDTRRIGALRIFIGLIQGLALYLLFESAAHRVWPGSDPVASATLASALVFAPLVLVAGLTAFRRNTLVLWWLAAEAIAAFLMGYAAWRAMGAAGQIDVSANNPFAPAVAPLVAAILFIGNHLLEGSEIDRRFVAAYPSYFEPAWKHGVQGVLSVIFTAVFWGLLLLGAELFKLIHISLLADVIDKTWFIWPATAMAFTAAVHLTDVRPAVVRGVRTVALTLLAWLTPLLVLLAGAFLIALPFTGLQPLWQTRVAATILLTAASMLVLLINADQDGTEPPNLVLGWAVRAGGVILVPLVVLAGIGLALRIQQYGLTPQRILAAAWALIAAGYAVGYGFGAVRPGVWMKPLERTNVAVAWLILLLAALLFTPIADPARLSVADQVARLDSGRTAPDQFDYAFLHFRAARFGREALERLAVRKGSPHDAVIADLAGRALKQANVWSPPLSTPQQVASRFTVYPKGAVLPEGFAQTDFNGAYIPCLNLPNGHCNAYLFDLDGDGTPEVLLDNEGNNLLAFGRGADGKWTQIGTFNGCPVDLKTLEAGQIRTIPAESQTDLEVGGLRLRFTPDRHDPVCSKPRPLQPVQVKVHVRD